MPELPSNTTALVFMAHPDDAEFLCAGTLIRLTEAGWSIHSATATAGDCGTVTESTWRISATWTEEAAKAALIIGATYHCLDERDGLVVYDKAVERAREAVTQLLDTADKVGVDLCVENVWNGLFYSPLELIDFVDSFQSDRLGIYFDVGNVWGYHQGPVHWIQLLGKRVGNNSGITQIGYARTLVAEMMPWDSMQLARTSAAMDQIMAI